MTKPNFKIIEGDYSTVDYETFKKDFMNPDILAGDIRKKYGISPKNYRKLSHQVYEEEGISRKPSRSHSILKHYDNQVSTEDMYIRKAPTGGFSIVKVWDYKSHYFGRYPDIETARMVRDALVESKWDLNVRDEMILKYSVKPANLAYRKAESMFDKFEELYFHSDLKISEILKKYHISSAIYGYLIQMIRKKYGDGTRVTLRKAMA